MTDRAAVEDLRDRWEQRLRQAGWNQGPIPIIETLPETTWIWSDLHLSDRTTIEVFARPFANTAAMNAHLLRAWRRHVDASETIICLGDVAHSDAWRDPRLIAGIRSCPGKRLLVLGNHDNHIEPLREAGFTSLHHLAMCATDPPLALSHQPLALLPGGNSFNVHGHFHEGTEPTGRHINVAIEQTGYKPIRLSAVLAEARQRTAAGRYGAPAHRALLSAARQSETGTPGLSRYGNED